MSVKIIPINRFEESFFFLSALVKPLKKRSDNAFSIACCMVRCDSFSRSQAMLSATICQILSRTYGDDSTSEITAAGANSSRDGGNGGGTLRSSEKSTLSKVWVATCSILPVRQRFSWLCTMRNNKYWLRKIRFGSPVGGMSVRCNRVVQTFFHIVGDRKLYENVKNG